MSCVHISNAVDVEILGLVAEICDGNGHAHTGSRIIDLSDVPNETGLEEM